MTHAAYYHGSNCRWSMQVGGVSNSCHFVGGKVAVCENCTMHSVGVRRVANWL